MHFKECNNLMRTDCFSINFNQADFVSQNTSFVSIIKINLLIMFRKIMAVRSEFPKQSRRLAVDKIWILI
jgi:hypothetical protein